jgi:hypothetical protein
MNLATRRAQHLGVVAQVTGSSRYELATARSATSIPKMGAWHLASCHHGGISLRVHSVATMGAVAIARIRGCAVERGNCSVTPTPSRRI